MSQTRREILLRSGAAAFQTATGMPSLPGLPGRAFGVLTSRAAAPAFHPQFAQNYFDAVMHLVIDPCRRKRLGGSMETLLDLTEGSWNQNYSEIIDGYLDIANVMLRALKSSGVDALYPSLQAHAAERMAPCHHATLSGALAFFRDKPTMAAELARLTGTVREALAEMESQCPPHVRERLHDFNPEQARFTVNVRDGAIALRDPHMRWGQGQIRASRPGILEFMAEMNHLLRTHVPADPLLPLSREGASLLKAVGGHPINLIHLSRGPGGLSTASVFNREVPRNAALPSGSDMAQFDRIYERFAGGSAIPPYPKIEVGTDFFLNAPADYAGAIDQLRRRFDAEQIRHTREAASRLRLDWLGVQGQENGLEGAFMESQAVCALSGMGMTTSPLLQSFFAASGLRALPGRGFGEQIVVAEHGAPEASLETLSRWARNSASIAADLERHILRP